jgi:Polyketide cyclase / dehydrase and lipid transport
MATFTSLPSQAFTLDRVETKYADSRYQLELVATIAAPIASVRTVLEDYETYPSLDPRILEARVLERPEPNVVVLYTKLRACFGWFCRNVRRTELVRTPENALIAVAIPERSDVRFGQTSMELTEVGETTRIHYRTSIDPAFWVPPIIGRSIMLNTLRDATVDLLKRVEHTASAAAAAQP